MCSLYPIWRVAAAKALLAARDFDRQDGDMTIVVLPGILLVIAVGT
jgi:hypothetical protein